MSYWQSFLEQSDRKMVAPRLKKLRALMKKKKIDGFLVPRADVHRGESVSKSEERLAWLTGFTGSAGLAIIGTDFATLFVDSRYILQAPNQTDNRLIVTELTPPTNIAKWIRGNFSKGSIIVFDAWLHTYQEIKKLQGELKDYIKLQPSENLIDMIWDNRPPAPTGEIEFLDVERSGQESHKKLAQLQANLASKKCDAIILTIPENICWLFNMRGHDVPNTPIVLCFAIVPIVGTPRVYFNSKRIKNANLASLKTIAHLADMQTFAQDIKRIGDDKSLIWLDGATIPQAIVEILNTTNGDLFIQPDPSLLAKAKKNSTELTGMKRAHLLDGVAMAKFLCWFEQTASLGKLNEIEIVKKLEDFRKLDESLVDISFDTIAGAGKNGAIVHYRVNEKSNRTLKKNELMLVDSGGQYFSGTTDITRTLFIGTPSAEQKDSYTRVLKGMIALSLARFPKGTTGAQIDILARQFLWQNGKTYNHGTGHGVGAYLSVHEAPFSISPRASLPLEENIILSIEPGYYKENEYGIRIENLVHIKQSDVGEDYFEFETLTLAPIEKRLIEMKMLTRSEINWLNAYHQKVWDKISPSLKGKEKVWLKGATKAI